MARPAAERQASYHSLREAPAIADGQTWLTAAPLLQ
jgi:hypothetical protein